MTQEFLKGKWNELKGEVQRKWGKLTLDQVNMIEGDLGKLTGAVQQRYGLEKFEAARQVDEWLNEQQEKIKTKKS